MLFNSYIFILLFLPLVLLGYYGLNKTGHYRAGILWIVAMSFWFYGYFSIAYLALLIGSICLNHVLVGVMERVSGRGLRRAVFAGAAAMNLGILFYFKYYDFFISNLNQAFGSDFVLNEILLPLGISFFTFQQLSYVADCYRGTAKRYPLLEYAAYVTFFPQLIAGPIVLHDELIPQFRDPLKKRVCYENLCRGIYAFALGLGKKVLIADTFSKVASIGFDHPYALDTTNLLIAMFCYSFQIYFDFSGYCDMAYGIGYLFNIELPVNFNSPYKAVSVSDFWDRWHMTLTRFFTRYVYIPLGGSRKGKLRTYLNTMAVFLVSGIWHGANWTFILWGVINGAAITIEKMAGDVRAKSPCRDTDVPARAFVKRAVKCVRTTVTFILTTFAWSLFRSESVEFERILLKGVAAGRFGPVTAEYTQVINDMPEVRLLCRMGLEGAVEAFPWLILLTLMAAALFGVWFMRNTQEKAALLSFENTKGTGKRLAASILILTWSILSLSEISEFLYFNF